MESGLAPCLLIGAVLFSCGFLTILVKRNAVAVLIGIELMLNAANVNLVAFSYYKPKIAFEAVQDGRAADLVVTRGNEVVGYAATSSALNMDGQLFAIFVIILAAAEAAVGLAIVIRLANQFKTVDVTTADTLKG